MIKKGVFYFEIEILGKRRGSFENDSGCDQGVWGNRCTVHTII